jgi:hypothetical protein
MRELWATGWMQQSVRMVCAAFLVEYLSLHWVHGCRRAPAPASGSVGLRVGSVGAAPRGHREPHQARRRACPACGSPAACLSRAPRDDGFVASLGAKAHGAVVRDVSVREPQTSWKAVAVAGATPFGWGGAHACGSGCMWFWRTCGGSSEQACPSVPGLPAGGLISLVKGVLGSAEPSCARAGGSTTRWWTRISPSTR